MKTLKDSRSGICRPKKTPLLKKHILRIRKTLKTETSKRNHTQHPPPRNLCITQVPLGRMLIVISERNQILTPQVTNF